MADLAIQFPTSPAGGIVNPYLGDFLGQFAVDYWPPHEVETSRTQLSVIASQLPVSAVPRAIESQQARSYSADYYHRIHINPTQLDLGNVVSTQTSTVRVWNAFLVPHTLTAISGMDEGIDLTGQAAPPLLFPALKEREWQVSVSPEGQPVLDTTLTWSFDNGAAAGLRITANRIIAWSWVPDWADGIIERLIWATDILQSESAVEQRRSIRLAPRREFEATMYLEGRERQLFDLALHGWGGRIWAMPVWPDIQILAAGVPLGAQRISCSTVNLDLRVGGLVMLRGETAFQYEVGEVAAIDTTGIDLVRPTQQQWPAGTRLYPMRSAQLQEQPSLTRLTDQASAVDVRLLVVESCDWPAVMPTTLYRGRSVYDVTPDESEDLTSAFARLTNTLDGGTGIPLITDIAGRALAVLGHRWLDLGRAARASLRSFLYAMRGRQKAVWIPTHAADLDLVSEITSVATAIDVANVGYSRFASAKPGRRDIRMQLWDGTVFYRRVIGSTELDADIERLAVDQVFGRQILPEQVARISWMALMRLDSDTVEIEHQTDSEGVATCAITFREVRDDEF